MSHVLSERELTILHALYGLNEERAQLKDVAESLNISPERVRQLRNFAEYKIIRALLVKLRYETNLTMKDKKGM
ncbi:sigma factor-like helix-turn-helix DNA-binding protein [Neobacillus sp. OS1-33]|uniref:sigma factor-like helix-turn-helix DNA-binding protein n=1 Tax=Neobacillus sp. OS1-33 TaxID=3070683 RepID=UPI0027E11018|nr:sigma factor-like helix-turn-helix DNA-binding protein [Neobacillus sp. OS1-33]WML28344.1 sigma factor-like helix-turn-helix DNA-binding protein [Neobacillus sp. OS1-33]